ncbi:DUF2087 domain-containing protein [Isoptericola halotolerans]|uniref:DUF2087 domain-containing protein n=1 Tax=Isoptericola halotolerans TaxID=300560 RepID=A0ABX2A1K1_9MICO|nr:DUF2087 domain-containing protein [Isoptericola halotolerans]NOV95476.1 hypothetical protein [Isoptericola halotolerans]
MSNEWRQVVAALADEDRLRLFARIVEGGPGRGDAGAPTAEVLIVDALTADDRRRLSTLCDAGLVSVQDGTPRAAPGRFRELLTAAASAEPAPPSGPERLLTDGRLQGMPRRQRDRQEVVRYLATQVLALHEPVSERTLTDRLRRRTADPVGLRRALVDAGLVTRTRDGAEYWRTTVTEFDSESDGASPP